MLGSRFWGRESHGGRGKVEIEGDGLTVAELEGKHGGHRCLLQHRQCKPFLFSLFSLLSLFLLSYFRSLFPFEIQRFILQIESKGRVRENPLTGKWVPIK